MIGAGKRQKQNEKFASANIKNINKNKNSIILLQFFNTPVNFIII